MDNDKELNELIMSLSEFGAEQVATKPNRKPTTTQPECSAKEEELLKAIRLTQWAICGSSQYKPVSTTFPKLQPGVYSVCSSNVHGIFFEKKTICVDDLLLFPDSVSDVILKEIETFWTKEKSFKKHGFLHRRGYLLYGPAGSGKTCIVHQIMHDVEEAGGLVFQCDCHPSLFNNGLALFREIEPQRPVVCLFEDIDAIIASHGEDEILALLDGENQINRVLNIATTNYPERLDKRLVARPRRFDRVIKVDMPCDAVRRLYFEKKLGVDKDLAMWVKATKGFSFAALAELVISVCCFENDFNISVKRLDEMMTANISSRDYDYQSKVGFGNEGSTSR
jgi:hypothetical protein